MFKNLILILIFILTALIIYPQDIPNYDMNEIHVFNKGSDNEEIGVNLKAPTMRGPSAFAFDAKGNLYISDMLNDRLQMFDQQFIYSKTFKDSFSKYARQLLIDDNENFLTYYNGEAIAIDDSKGEKKSYLSITESKFKDKTIFSPFLL